MSLDDKHGEGATPRTDAMIAGQEQRKAIYFPLRLDETISLARQLERELAESKKMHGEAIENWVQWEARANRVIKERDRLARPSLAATGMQRTCPPGTCRVQAPKDCDCFAPPSPLAATGRSFPICKDHRNADWNKPDLEDGACVLCTLFYLEAQESLLEEWQERAKKAEADLAETKRPLDEQMARLNDTVTRLNGELATALSHTVPTNGEVLEAYAKGLKDAALSATLPSAEAVRWAKRMRHHVVESDTRAAADFIIASADEGTKG